MRTRTTFAATSLRALGGPPVAVRRAGGDDVDEIVAIVRQVEASCDDCGSLALTRADVVELVSDPDNFCYCADDGFLVYAWDGEDLRVERLLAASSATTRALWALVGSGSSAVREVYTFQPVHDPLHWIVPEPAAGAVHVERWMLRILDVTEAIRGRGFPAGVHAAVPLVLDDVQLDRNAGAFRLDISGGSGALVRLDAAAPGAVHLAARGLAAMYAGTPLATLRRAGLVTGGSVTHHALLDAAFAAHPYLVDRF